MPDRDHRSIVFHPDTSSRRAGRWALAALFSLGPLFMGGGDGVWAWLFFGVLWGGWGLAVGWVLHLLVGPTHEIAVAGERVYVDGELAPNWRDDSRLLYPLILDRDGLVEFIEHDEHEEAEPAVRGRVASVSDEIWEVEDRVPEPSLWWIGWTWVATSALCACVVSPVMAPVAAVTTGFGMLLALLVYSFGLEVVGRHQSIRALHFVGDHMEIDGERVHLGHTRFLVEERTGYGTLWAIEGGRRLRIAHHDIGETRGLARELRARAAAARDSAGGEVPREISALMARAKE